MSKLSSKKGKHFCETKVFEVYDSTQSAPLVDENGEVFTVEMYAPQSGRMLAFDKMEAQQARLRAARTNGASEKNVDLDIKRGARRFAHAIKSWHPVTPDGEFISEYANASEAKIAELLTPNFEADSDEDISWLTEQLGDFFKKSNFVLSKTETELKKKTSTDSTKS